MSDQGLKVDVQAGESAMTFGEMVNGFGSFVDKRVLVSIADEDGNACGSVRGVLKRFLETPSASETGRIVVYDIGIDGVVILSDAAFRGARWSGDVLALQQGGMLLTVRYSERYTDDGEEAV